MLAVLEYADNVTRMSSIVGKIEADASARLVLPAGKDPRQEIARYKAFLKVEQHRLRMLHKGGTGGRDVCRLRAAVLDQLITRILDAIKANLLAAGSPCPKFSLVAIGGYGRGELNPLSDIDIMFLHETSAVTAGKAAPTLGALTDGLLYTLWDSGLKVGHSVRSPDDCVVMANSDMQSKTSLLEARLVYGDKGLFDKMCASLIARSIRGKEAEYIQERLEDQESRRSKHGNSATMQEPNIKNGCGGLRDYQNLLWMVFVKYRIRSLEDVEKRGLLSDSDRRHLDAAYDFLLWTRNELHYQSKRPTDTLTKQLQASVSNGLGYPDRSPSKRIEAFMKDLYRHMRNIHLITRTLEQRLALQPDDTRRRLPSLADMLRRRKLKKAEQTVDGFTISNGEINNAGRSFKEQPRRMIRAYLHAQQRGVRMSPDLSQTIRQELALVDNAFMKDEKVRETFLEILNRRGNVAPTLRAMHETGFLGKYIPEFGKLTCLVQHEFYHQYAADEHTLKCIEKLDGIWNATKPPEVNYVEMFLSVERPFVLYLALLLHDAGKALHTGKHEEVGGRLAVNVSNRLGLDGSTTHSLQLLIENHLTMTQTSQRRDIEDPEVIKAFAGQIQSRENLVMLTLHTLADSLGTSDNLWNGFKDSLLQTLYSKALSLLEGGTEFIRAEVRQLELLKEEVRNLLPRTFSPEEIEAHWTHMPPRYFHLHSPRQIVRDLTMIHRFMHLQVDEADKALEPVVVWHNEPDRAHTLVHICTWDRERLFSKICGSLTAAGLNILSGQIFSRADGIILDTFIVTDAMTGGLANKEERERFEEVLTKVLGSEADLGSIIGKLKSKPGLYQPVDGDEIATQVHFDNDAALKRTVLDVETEDRIGLLYILSQTLAELGLDLALAKISTEKGAAMDTFYVRNRDGTKIEIPAQQQKVAERIKSAVAKLDRKR